MLDSYIENQKVAYSIVKNAINNDKISHAYLIETNGNKDGINFAISFAKALLCPNLYTNSSKCGNCKQCKTIDDNNFIELDIIDTDEIWIKKEKIESLQNIFKFKPIIGHKKIYIINDADKIKESLANTLLKFIEEPEEGIIAILVTENRNKIIDTILSRCQIVSLNKKNDFLDNNINEMYDENILLMCIKFINYFEKNGLETILYTNTLFHNYLNERKDYEVAFNIILLYYKDVLNFMLYKQLNLFRDYDIYVKEIININNINKLLKKIDLIIYLKNIIKNNVNINLLTDKLIISLKKV